MRSGAHTKARFCMCCIKTRSISVTRSALGLSAALQLSFCVVCVFAKRLICLLCVLLLDTHTRTPTHSGSRGDLSFGQTPARHCNAGLKDARAHAAGAQGLCAAATHCGVGSAVLPLDAGHLFLGSRCVCVGLVGALWCCHSPAVLHMCLLLGCGLVVSTPHLWSILYLHAKTMCCLHATISLCIYVFNVCV